MTGSNDPGRFPRVLILTNNRLQRLTAGGIILATLFSDFPVENLFVVHTDITPGGPEGYLEARLTRLKPRLAALPKLLWRFLSSAIGNPSDLSRADITNATLQSCRFRLTEPLMAEIMAFGPEVIYAWVGDSLWARLLEDFVDELRLPYVIHFMDNHYETPVMGRLSKSAHEDFRKNLRRMVAGAERIFTISEAMGLAYERFFGKPFEVFHGVIEKDGWSFPPERSASEFSLVFTGSLETGQLNGLRAVAEAVEAINRKGRPIELVLYLTEYYEQRAKSELLGFEQVKFRRHPESSHLRPALVDSDLLVLAYGFDASTIGYYRYSFATKTVPYMLSGRCILAYGPAEIEPISYLERGGWAYVVSEESVATLEEAILKLMDNPDLRNRIARNAYDAGLDEHDLSVHASRFHASLAEVAGHGMR